MTPKRAVTVRFPDHLLERLDARVEAGEFSDRSEALREGARRVATEGEVLERLDVDRDDLRTLIPEEVHR